MAEFTLSSQTVTSRTAVTRLAGDMDANSFAMLEEEFHKVLDAGALGLVLDISGLDSMTSAGLGAVINLSQILEDRRGKLVVAGARPKIMGILEMLGVEEALTLADTPEQGKKVVASLKLQ